ncbi:MAG: translation initiation factor IF-2 [Pirellulaceae bacterium]|nr:MAG: translation initiation factor IF-2 [Pirellulaceae bacterium]
MPTRIYQLAKELQRDTKELVEICQKIGITQKGSPLASLDDDEVAKVKAYLEQAKAPPSSASVSAPSASISAPNNSSDAPVAAAPVTPDTLVPPLVKPAAKIKVLGAKKKSTAEQKPAGEQAKKERPKPRAPVIHVAQLPDVQAPAPPPPPQEPPVQKPELRLPADAIRSARAGSRAPIEELAEKVRQRERAKERLKDRDKEPRDVPSETAKETKKGLKGRGKKDVDLDEIDSAMADMASARADRQKRRMRHLETRDLEEEVEEPQPVVRRRLQRRRGSSTAAPRKSKIVVELPCTVRTFSEATGVSSAKVLATALKLGQMLNINAALDPELVELLAVELGLDIELKKPESPEEKILREIREQQDDPALLVPRPPVVTFLGHVDHGKTSMLDYLIGTNVAAKEAGGITQHIRAYQVKTPDGRPITFVDTPGHEAFTEMRARGAHVTDIAVIVIAADDGIMPQTEEAISHAQAAGVPIVVAINKIDLPGVRPERILTQLTEHNLTPSQWGGDVEVVHTSAITGQGMDTLLETLLTIAELHDFRANPQRRAYGVCLEAEQAGSRGVVAKLIVQNGTLRVGDVIVCGTAHGHVRAMFDTLRTDERLEEAPPSCPVNVIGLDEPPEAGQMFYVVDDIGLARDIAERRREQQRAMSLAGTTARISFDRFQQMLQEGRLGAGDELVTLNLIVRADTRGSIDAIMKELEKLHHPEVQLRVLLKGVGGITVGDVHLAEASDAVILGFNVTADEAARELAEQKHVEIRRYDIIYQLTDDLKAVLEGRLKPQEQIVELGRAVVKQVFSITRVGNVAGCYVVQGKLERGCRVRVFRDGRKIGDYVLESLRREKDDVREVTRGFECGVKLGNFDDVKQDDILEAYKIEEVARKL